MLKSQIVQAWGKILRGEQPSLSIEITKECPLRCPGCYAYDAAHLGGDITLRELSDRKGEALVDGSADRVKVIAYSGVFVAGEDTTPGAGGSWHVRNRDRGRPGHRPVCDQ